LRCMVCQRPLKTEKAKAAGVGSTCAKKLDQEAIDQLREISSHGFGGKLIDHRVIQIEILEETGETPPEKIWNYPKGVKKHHESQQSR
jgi:hypothetical protein